MIDLKVNIKIIRIKREGIVKIKYKEYIYTCEGRRYTCVCTGRTIEFSNGVPFTPFQDVIVKTGKLVIMVRGHELNLYLSHVKDLLNSKRNGTGCL